MANDLTSTPNLYVIDSRGIIRTRPVCVSHMIYVPSAAADDITLYQWDENAPVSAGTKTSKAGAISATKTLTSTGNLSSAVAAGYIFHIRGSSGDQDNLGRKLVEVAGDDNAITITEDDWTNEDPIYYDWTTYPSTTAYILKAGASDASPIHKDFGERGRWFPNLACHVIDGGQLYIYIK